ncbi:hypothetical protein QN277_002025 [Acacia crassicarpa]|uniref:BRCT domain-containing protein n=1 Tax=Acacia crassicarpa TaxID=499986 RepID=A0AAE1N9J7_9FABA|nr:hypothetical protein QN277_002025 [Acacia crassicarpa]
MANLGLRPPQFSEDVAWVPAWFQNLRTDGSYEYVKESEIHLNENLKDLAVPQENFGEGKDSNAQSGEECGYKSCHLFLSGEDNSPTSLASSPGNEQVLHFRLRLSDVDSLFSPTPGLNASNNLVASSKVLSMQPVQNSVDFGENLPSMMDNHASEQNVLPSSIPETVKMDGPKLPSDNIDSVRKQNEKSNVRSFKNLVASNNLVASSKVLSMQPAKNSVHFGENLSSMMGNRASEQNVLSSSIPETVKMDGPKCPSDNIDSVRKQKEKSNLRKFRNADISNAVELSIAASEALVIHEIVKMESVSEKYPAEAVLEVALRVKQARLEGLEDGFLSSNEESDWSDSLSDLNDVNMEDAYEDVGLPSGIFLEEHQSSAMAQVKDISDAGKYHGCVNELREHISQFVNLDDNSAKKPLEVNAEIELQQKEDSPVHSLCCERDKHSDDLGLGHIYHHYVRHTSNVSTLNQDVDPADLASNRLQNRVNSPLVGNTKKNILASYLVPDRFKSRWFGGWTTEELDSSPCEQKNAERSSKFFIRETSFLSESADVPDENSCLQKHESKCAIGSQLSIPSETLHKADEDILHSQNVAQCSNLSLDDPLCSVVPCSIPSELTNSKPQSQDIDNDVNVPAIPEFEADNCQMIRGDNVVSENRDKQIMSSSDGEDIPATITNMVQQTPQTLTIVAQTCLKQLRSLKTYSMIIPNQSLVQKCNQALLRTNQWMDVAALSDKKRSKGLSASKFTDGSKTMQNHELFVNHKSTIEITNEKRTDDLKEADKSSIPVESLEERALTPILNDRIQHSLLGPKIFGNDINGEKHPNKHVPPKSLAQHQQNNLKLQAECSEFHDGHVGVKKRVRSTEEEERFRLKRTLSKLESSNKKSSFVREKRRKPSKSLTNSVPHMKHSLTNYCRKVRTKYIFLGTEFLLTGLSSQKERDMEELIRNSGGVVLSDIPSRPISRRKRSSTFSRLQLPVILCMRKLQTAKFLYGCAVGAAILKVDWLTDSITAGTIVHPEKYMILPNRNDMKLTMTRMLVRHNNQKPIFERVGFMLHGKHSFCTKLASIIKHGGGQVYKTLQWLVRSIDKGRVSGGAIIVKDKPSISRHLKSCALEKEIPIMPLNWIIKSLYSGELLPFTEENRPSLLPIANVLEVPDSMDVSEEI